MTQIQEEEEEKKVLGIHQMCMVPLSELQQDKMLSMLSKMFRMFKMLTKHSGTRVSHLKLKISPAAKTPNTNLIFSSLISLPIAQNLIHLKENRYLSNSVSVPQPLFFTIKNPPQLISHLEN